ncbi:PucR family transcriptional regulator [Streptomyces sp. NBC_00083]|uniref:PucR family transcriptional regulator n=1 Tax=Streptomyces sp. NBC_00083 TaxID=2975647 RepID=UPI002258280A|nr:PucR family transcriptional regulator [Streptomyces sp. NBC_00083]MCX5382312.1 PucR family transcriptional regulator [Streptomyces sp. NBC_00083]
MPEPTAPPVPPPATPPTPPIALAALLARADLGLRQLAGPSHASIRWVHTSEMADPYPYLLGGELLMTAGVQLADPEVYVSRVVAAGAAALGFGVAPVHEEVPPALVEACARHGLALIEVPPRTTFSAVARAVWLLMARAREDELRRVNEAQRALATAASRPDPVGAVLRVLAGRLGGWAGLLTPEGVVLESAGAEPGPLAGVRDLVRVVSPAADPPRPTPSRKPPAEATGRPPEAFGKGRGGDTAPKAHPLTATDTADGTHLAAYAPAEAGGTALAVATPHRTPGDHTIAGVAAVLLSLLTAGRPTAEDAARSAALVRLLLGGAPQEAGALLGAGPWVVVHGRGEGSPPGLGALVDRAGPALRALVPADREVAPHPGWTLGVSAPAALEGLAVAGIQAARALERAEATRVPLARHRPAGFAALVDPAEAAAYARELLAPLGRPLRTTLYNWLALHGSWDRTAVALGVHRNTVRQRIGRCAALLGADLDDMDVRTELWLALRSAEAHSGQCR